MWVTFGFGEDFLIVFESFEIFRRHIGLLFSPHDLSKHGSLLQIALRAYELLAVHYGRNGLLVSFGCHVEYDCFAHLSSGEIAIEQ